MILPLRQSDSTPVSNVPSRVGIDEVLSGDGEFPQSLFELPPIPCAVDEVECVGLIACLKSCPSDRHRRTAKCCVGFDFAYPFADVFERMDVRDNGTMVCQTNHHGNGATIFHSNGFRDGLDVSLLTVVEVFARVKRINFLDVEVALICH